MTVRPLYWSAKFSLCQKLLKRFAYQYSGFFMQQELKQLLRTVKRVSLNPNNPDKTKELAKKAEAHLIKLLKENHAKSY